MLISFSCVNNNSINNPLNKKTPVFNFKGNQTCDVFCFSSNSQNAKIKQLKNKTAQEFFTDINKKSPKKCELLLNNEQIIRFANEKHDIFSDSFSKLHIEDLKILNKTIDNLDEKEIDDIIKSTEKRLDTANGRMLINALSLANNDKNAFDYALKSPYYEDDVIYSSGYSKDLFRYILALNLNSINTLSYNSVLEIEKGLQDDYDYTLYTSNSDSFNKDRNLVSKLSEFLSKNISEGDFIVYRGEKSPWLFDSVEIDNEMQNEIREIVKNRKETREDLVYPNNNCYSTVPKDNIYKYINQKEKLSLADAMLCAKYADENFLNKILNKINNSRVIDNNFKSYTLDKKFAQNWAKKKNGFKSENDNMVSILTMATIKKGNQLGYAPRSRQAEFILNNNEKNITFSNAKYDKETNTFHIESIII